VGVDDIRDCVKRFLDIDGCSGLVFDERYNEDTIAKRAKYLAMEYKRIGWDVDTTRSHLEAWATSVGQPPVRVKGIGRYVSWCYKTPMKPLGCSKRGALRRGGFCLLDHNERCTFYATHIAPKHRAQKNRPDYPETFDVLGWSEYLVTRHRGRGYKAVLAYRILRARELWQGATIAIAYRGLRDAMQAMDKDIVFGTSLTEVVRAVQILQRYALIEKTHTGYHSKYGGTGDANRYKRIIPTPKHPGG